MLRGDNVYPYEIRRQKALKMASVLTREEKENVEKLKCETNQLSGNLKKAHQGLFRKISLKLMWEFDPSRWSDCPHHDELTEAIEERFFEKRAGRKLKSVFGGMGAGI